MVFIFFVNSGQTYSVQTHENRATVSPETFPSHMALEIWVEAHNKLGKVESEHLKEDADWFGKLNSIVLYM